MIWECCCKIRNLAGGDYRISDVVIIPHNNPDNFVRIVCKIRACYCYYYVSSADIILLRAGIIRIPSGLVGVIVIMLISVV